MTDQLTTLRAALNSAEQSKKQLNKLWVSHHANGTDAAIESCESSITDLRTLIASMEAQPITVFVALQKKHQKYVKVSHGAMIEEILAVCGTHDAALSVCNAAEEKYHEDFPGYRQYKEEPEHSWEVVEIEADFPLYTRPTQPASEPKAAPTQLDAQTAYKLAKQCTVLDAREDGEALPEDVIWEFAQAILRTVAP